MGRPILYSGKKLTGEKTDCYTGIKKYVWLRLHPENNKGREVEFYFCFVF